MMSRLWIGLVLAAAQPAAGALASALPAKIGYTIYSRGERVGHADITVGETGGTLTFKSKTTVQFGEHNFELECLTEADKGTYMIRHVEYRGVKAGTPMSGSMTVDGDSLYGTVVHGESETQDYRISPHERNLVLEDYVMEHEVLLALAHVAGRKNDDSYGMMLPSSFVMTSCAVMIASQAEIESENEAVVCDKILVAISGSEPFASFYDRQRRLPIYIAFPQTAVEVFLDDFFGDSPVSRFRE